VSNFEIRKKEIFNPSPPSNYFDNKSILCYSSAKSFESDDDMDHELAAEFERLKGHSTYTAMTSYCLREIQMHISYVRHIYERDRGSSGSALENWKGCLQVHGQRYNM
jgi:hypothetical protein